MKKITHFLLRRVSWPKRLPRVIYLKVIGIFKTYREKVGSLVPGLEKANFYHLQVIILHIACGNITREIQAALAPFCLFFDEGTNKGKNPLNDLLPNLICTGEQAGVDPVISYCYSKRK